MKILFVDFWPDFSLIEEKMGIFSFLLFSDNTDLMIFPDEFKTQPDFVIYSVFGNNHLKFKGIPTILYSGENINRWNNIVCRKNIHNFLTNTLLDCPNFDNDKFTYSPHFIFDIIDIKKFMMIEEKDSILTKGQDNKMERKFCCFVTNNGKIGDLCNKRNEFFITLDKILKVDSAGPNLNNMNGFLAPRGKDYFPWIANYTFMIAFENSIGEGYITEKIINPLRVGTIPIYCGSAHIFKYVNSDAFIWIDPMEDISKGVAKVLRVYYDKELLRNMQNAKPLTSEAEKIWYNVRRKIHDIIYKNN